MSPTHTPVSVITGPLGIGKTTALLDTFRHRPDGERWAVLVNEFGKVGIDGAVLSEGGVAVREIPGGCVCCVQGPQLQVGLVRLLRELRPDRLLIEPSGLAMPGAILDALGRQGLVEHVARRATITLVDPVFFASGRWEELDADSAQVDAADVLVANRADRATPAQLDAFREAAAKLWPAKTVVATTSFGQLDPAWLDLDPRPRASGRFVPVHAHTADEHGLLWTPDVRFDRRKLVAAVQSLAVAGPALPYGALRIKGLFRTDKGWVRIDAVDARVDVWPTQWRTDSRVELIAQPPADWAAVERAFEDARLA